MATVTKSQLRRREQIVRVATKVFAEKGYRASTIQDLARELDVTSAAFYYYFDSKQELLVEIVMRPMELLVNQAANILQRSYEYEIERIRDLVHGHIGLIVSERALFTVLLRERVELAPDAAIALRKSEDVYYDQIKNAIEACIESGEVAFPSPRLAALGLIGMMSWVLRWHDPARALSDVEIAESFYALFLGGVASGLRTLGSD